LKKLNKKSSPLGGANLYRLRSTNALEKPLYPNPSRLVRNGVNRHRQKLFGLYCNARAPAAKVTISPYHILRKLFLDNHKKAMY